MSVPGTYLLNSLLDEYCAVMKVPYRSSSASVRLVLIDLPVAVQHALDRRFLPSDSAEYLHSHTIHPGIRFLDLQKTADEENLSMGCTIDVLYNVTYDEMRFRDKCDFGTFSSNQNLIY